MLDPKQEEVVEDVTDDLRPGEEVLEKYVPEQKLANLPLDVRKENRVALIQHDEHLRYALRVLPEEDCLDSLEKEPVVQVRVDLLVLVSHDLQVVFDQLEAGDDRLRVVDVRLLVEEDNYHIQETLVLDETLRARLERGRKARVVLRLQLDQESV